MIFSLIIAIVTGALGVMWLFLAITDNYEKSGTHLIWGFFSLVVCLMSIATITLEPSDSKVYPECPDGILVEDVRENGKWACITEKTGD